MASGEVNEGVDYLQQQLDHISQKIKLFSLSLGDLYAEDSLGTSSDCADSSLRTFSDLEEESLDSSSHFEVKIRKVRDDTRNAAIAYVNSIVPLVKSFISKITQFFAQHQNLAADVWRDDIKCIVDIVKSHEKTCKQLLVDYKYIRIEQENRHLKVKKLMAKMKEFSARNKKRSEELEASHEYKMSLARALSFFPYIDVVAVPVLVSAKFDLFRSSLQDNELTIQPAMAMINSLNQAHSELSEVLQATSGVIAVIDQELEFFHGTGKTAMEFDSHLHIHYKLMTEQAGRLKDTCSKFIAILDSSSTDLFAIVKQGSD